MMRRRADGGANFAVAALLVVLLVGCGNMGDPFEVDLQQTLSVDQVNPPDGAVGVSVFTLMSLSFPVAIDTSTLGPTNLVLQDGTGSAVATAVTYDGVTRIVTVRPARTLTANTRHTLVVQGVRSSGGVAFRTQTFSFSTGAADPGGTPAIVAVAPLPTQQGVALNATVRVDFSRAMNRASAEAAFMIDGGVAGTFSWSDGDRRMTFTPATTLSYGMTYHVTVLNTAVDTTGIPLLSGTGWYFSTRTGSVFRVIESLPVDGATTAAADTMLRFVFTEPVDRSTVVTNFAISPALAVTADRFTYEQNDQVVIYDPPVLFSAGQTVRATWSTGLTSVNAERLESAFTIQFSIETAAPSILTFEPANGATQVPASQVIRVTFSEPLDPSAGNISAANFAVAQGAAVAGSLSLTNNGRTVVFVPTLPFVSGPTPVTVTVAGSVTDLAGTAMGGAVVSSFSIDSQAPGISFSIPADGATQVQPITVPTLVIVFTEPVNQTATGASFTISPASAGGGVVAWPSSNRLHYTTSTPLVGATLHTVSVTMQDLAGNTAPGSFSFTTDSIAPTAALVTPTPGATGVALDTLVVLSFSERMRRSTVESSFLMSDGTTTLRIGDGTATWDDVTWPSQLVFDPAVLLTASRTFTVVVTSGAQDIGGLGLSPSLTATFRTTGP